MAPQTQPPGTFANRYTIERELGRGGTATVYLAQDTTTSTSVALKVLHRELAESVAADRFLREFRMNAGLRHPHIAPILNSGQFGADLFLVMPHMESGSLRVRLDKERQLSVDAVVEIVRAVGSALQHAHERGFIHRDVKPENILFSGSEAYLSDFGIARAVERVMGDSTTSSGIVRGTPAYMSPEQASGDHRLDGRSDQFSFACVVYEMLAGVPPFQGPTQESTIAMRFRVPPREISVYRPAVSQAIERVIQKAMSLSPADRYASMNEFVKAFDAAVLNPPGPARAHSIARRDPRLILATIGSALVLLAIATAYSAKRGWFGRGATVADTTQVVVLPLETREKAATETGPEPYELLQQALRRWQDLHVVRLDLTQDALAGRGPGRLSPADMRSIASSVGARRFIVVRQVRTPTGKAVFAEYRDVETGPLHDAQLDLPADSGQLTGVYAALADSMVLRGETDDGPPGRAGPRHLFATQAFIRALNARKEWDLSRADSELATALSFDPAFSRAYVWQGQQRSWQGLDAQRWIVPVERALADTTSLTPSERVMAHALADLGHGQYQDACNNYKTLIKNNASNFVGWYGLGECNQKDQIVIPDSRSRSRWRYRGSLQQAVTSYTRAFQLIPATYRGFQRNGYRRLLEILFMAGNRWKPGTSGGDNPRRFYGIPAIAGDTLVLVPWPQADVTGQRVPTTGVLSAIPPLRRIFDTVVTTWSSAFPRSPATKEAVAISLDLRGDPAAIDTLEVAERLTADRAERVRLAAIRVSMQLKFNAAGSTEALGRVFASADSLLRMNSDPADPQIAGYLAPIAAMTGQCQRTSKLMGRKIAATADGPVPRDVQAEIASLEAYVVVGCQPTDVWHRLDDITSSFAGRQRTDAQEQALVEQVNMIIRSTLPPDSAWTGRFATRGGRLIAAEHFISEGRADSARGRLREAARVRRSALAGQVTAEAVVPEARAWLALADTAAAISSLEEALTTARHAPPILTDQTRYNTERMGFLIQAYALHALLLANRDRARARQSAKVAAVMWLRPDSSLRPVVAQLHEIMK